MDQRALLRLISTGQYERFNLEHAEYLSRTDTSDSQTLEHLIMYLRSVLLEVRTRRAHQERELAESRAAATYFVPRARTSALNVVG